MPTALILIADGTEEMELYVSFRHLKYNRWLNAPDSTITFDTLVRGGIKTASAFVPELSSTIMDASSSTTPTIATCSRGMKIVPDTVFDSAQCGPVC